MLCVKIQNGGLRHVKFHVNVKQYSVVPNWSTSNNYCQIDEFLSAAG